MSPQHTIAHYRITAKIGEGGMGEVYRATDTKLGRDVAIKILPDSFAQDAARMARFEREAKVLASLNHPHIAQIYSVEERALVMELVEGENLQGPLPVGTAIEYARQIAEALEAAHEKGITHRDLKPANVKVTPEGAVKVLDFGLAKVAEEGPGNTGTPGDGSRNACATISPTLSMARQGASAATQLGMIMGTAAHMSPEQAAGKPVDKRADIWSFGVVLWEMLTGQRLFDGETVSHTLAAVLRDETDFGRLPKETPAGMRELLGRCLERNTKSRLRDIGEARIALENLARQPQGLEPATANLRPTRLPWVIAAAAILIALGLGLVVFRRVPEEARVVKLSLLPPEKAVLTATSPPALSPDGRRLAFVATLDGKTGLWVRDLDGLAARLMSGTEGANGPFWSPDGRSLAFAAGGKLRRIDVAGGPSVSLCDATRAYGGSWNQNDIILFAPSPVDAIFRVPAAGGTATPATTLDRESGEIRHRFPWFLPDGHHFLYLGVSGDPEKTGIYVGDLDSKARRRVLTADSNAVYALPGYLLFVREGSLMAQPFDADKAQTAGDPVPLAGQVNFNYGGTVGLGQFSSSQNGVLAYASGGAGGNVQLTWFDPSGKVLGVVGAPSDLYWPAISPDGSSVVVDRRDPQTGLSDLWLRDLKRGAESRFTSGWGNWAIWSPDGGHIAFASSRGGPLVLHQKATSGSFQEEVLDKTAIQKWPLDRSRDGRYIIEQINDPKTGFDIWVLPLDGDRKPFPYLQTPSWEHFAKLSPDGRWLAYGSDETKRNEVYIQTFPTPGGKRQVSINGGGRPIWSRDGRQLFFIGADRKMMAVGVKNSAGKLELSVPKALFDSHIGANSNLWFDVAQDGRFLIPTQVEDSAGAPMTVVINWTAGLKR